MKSFKINLLPLFSAGFILVLAQCSSINHSAGQAEKTLIVGPETADCTGVVPMKCLQVKNTADGKWTNLYTTIEGFIYEPGYEYVLKIKEEKIANPPADGSSIKYILMRQVSRTKK